MVWLPDAVVWAEPLTLSGFSASTLIVPLIFIPDMSQGNLTTALLVVEVRIVGEHSFSRSLNGAFSSFSLVRQLFEVLVVVLPAEFAFILSSILARCSGVSLAVISGGMGISPRLVVAWVCSPV